MLVEDNKGCIFIIKNQATSARTKYINIRAHFMQNHYLKLKFDVLKTEPAKQGADPLTKNLCEKDHKRHFEKFQERDPICVSELGDLCLADY